MVNLTARTLGLVLSAIRNLCEARGSTPREILNYITNVHNVSPDVARRQMHAALRRGVAYGILKKSGTQYSLPTDTSAELEEVAAQELGLLDLCRRRKQKRRQRRRQDACKPKRRRRRRSGACKCRRRGRGRRRRRSRSSKRCARPERRKPRCAALADRPVAFPLLEASARRDQIAENRAELRTGAWN